MEQRKLLNIQIQLLNNDLPDDITIFIRRKEGITMPATNITVISSMEVQLTVNDASGSAKVMTLKEGQKVENLKYITGGAEETITGVIKVIRFNYVNPNVTDTCIHDAEPIFPKAVVPSNMVVDCSSENNSDLRVVVIRSIVDMDGSSVVEEPEDPDEPVDPKPEAPAISNIKIVNSKTVYFDSDVEVTSATWNGEEVTVTLVSGPETAAAKAAKTVKAAAVYTYKFTAPSIQETNSLVVNDAETAPTEVKPAEVTAIKYPELVNASDKGLSGNTLVCHGVPVTFTKAVVGGLNLAKWTPVSEYDSKGSQAFAEASIIIGGEIDGSDCESTNLTFESGTYKGSIFGGSYNGNVKNVNMTINDGTFRMVCGGGTLNADCETVNITVNGGTIESIEGGGHAYLSDAFNVGSASSGAESPNHVGTVTMDINGGTFTGSEYALVYGGGQGYSAVDTVNMTIDNADMSTNTYVTAGGSNGYTGDATVTIGEGTTIAILQSGNRGTMKTAKTIVNGGTINNMYLGGDTTDDSVKVAFTGTENPILQATINGGTITNLQIGTNGGEEIAAGDAKVAVTYAEAATITNLEAAKTAFGACLTAQG